MSIIKFLQSFSSPLLDNIFQIFTFMGEETVIIFAMVTLYWCFNKKAALKLGFIQLFSAVSNGAIKDLVNAQRPIGRDGIFSLRVETATGSSFPSGHTQGATTFWTTLMMLYRKTWIYIVGTLLIILVGMSRLYLGVHWPMDVFGGIFFGLVSMFLGNMIVDLMYAKKDYRYMLILVLPAVVGLIFFHSEDYAKSVSLSLGLYLGFVLEDMFINFDTRESFYKQAAKLVLGILGLLFIKQGLKYVLPNNHLGILIRYSAIGLWVSAAAPLVFIKLKLSSAVSSGSIGVFDKI